MYLYSDNKSADQLRSYKSALYSDRKSHGYIWSEFCLRLKKKTCESLCACASYEINAIDVSFFN